MFRAKIGFVVSALCLLASGAFGGDWQVDTAQSEISAVGTLNGKERTIAFKDYTASIAFDPADLSTGSISIDFDVTKMEDPLDFTGDVVATLMHSSWFDGETIAKASFVSEQIIQGENGDYEAVGTLTVKNIAKPVTVPFRFETIDASSAVAVTDGIALNRMDFELGKGWEFPGYEVGEDVTVKFRLVASRPAQ